METNTTQSSEPAAGVPADAKTQPQQGSRGMSPLVYIGAIVVVVIVIGLAYVFVLSPANASPSNSTASYSAPTTYQTVPIATGPQQTINYLSANQIALLFGSAPSIYYNYNLFSASNSSINIENLESQEPFLKNNVSAGWMILASGNSSSKSNASMIYYILKTANTPMVGTLAASAGAELIPNPTNTSYGVANGLNYTYEFYQNKSFTNNVSLYLQFLSGWKDNETVVLAVQGYNFYVNKTELVNVAAEDMP
jgi:flagellar basal body-associated protein FliL